MNGQLALFEGGEETLDSAKRRLREGLEDGTNCPCCGRWAQAYWRGINKTMAKALRWLEDERNAVYYGSDYDCQSIWIDITKGPAWLLRSNQLATLRWWKLVERMPNEDSAKKHSGMWRVTSLGVSFLAGNSTTPRRVCTLFGEVVAVSEDRISVHDIRHHFDYSEVMGK